VVKTVLGSGGIGLVLGFALGIVVAGNLSTLTSFTLHEPSNAPKERENSTFLVSDVLERADELDGRSLWLEGRVTGLVFKVSRSGNPYTLFTLEDSTGTLKVYVRGHPDLQDGDSIRVNGTFSRIKRVGKYTFENELEAREIRRID
jgi:hypothetical protein